MPRPEDGGTASGEIFVGRQTTNLAHAYAVALVPRGGGPEQVTVVLSDRPVPSEVLADLKKLNALAAEDNVRAVSVTLSADNRALAADFFHPELPQELMVKEVSRFTPSSVDRTAVAGRVEMKDPGFSFGYSAEFRAPIYRPPEKPRREIPASASPSERARLLLEEEGLSFDVETFRRKVVDGDAEAVALFLDAGMSPNRRIGMGSALWEAVGRGHLRVAEILIARGADLSERDPYGQSLVMAAADLESTEMLAMLLKAGADPNVANQYRVAPLEAAAEQGKKEHVQRLLAAGARVNARNTAGGTALSVAVLRGHTEIVRMLLDAGADVLRDKKDLLETARRQKHPEIARMIEEAAKKQGSQRLP